MNSNGFDSAESMTTINNNNPSIHDNTVDSSSSSCLCTTTTLAAVLTSLILVWVCLFKFKNPLQFYVKYTTYVCMTISISVVFIPVALLRPFSTKNVDLVAKLLTFLFRIFRVRVKLENEKYFKSDQPYIIITNHQSSLDFMTMMNVWPGGNCTPLAKKELFYVWPFGFTIWLCGITFIDRLNAERARSTIDELANKINRENLRVWIFPEGTRSPNTRLLPFKKGAFHLAVQAQVPIVCVVTSSYSNFYNKRERKFLNEGEVRVRVLPPFQTKNLGLEDVPKITKHLQSVMQRELDELNKEIGLDPKYLVDPNTADSTCHNCAAAASSERSPAAKSKTARIEKIVGEDDNNNSMVRDDEDQDDNDDDDTDQFVCEDGNDYQDENDDKKIN